MPALPADLALRPRLTLAACAHIFAHVAAARVLEAVRAPKPARRQAWRRAMTVGCLASAATRGGRLA